MAEVKRRQFLKSSTWAGASLIGTAKAWAGANDRIRVALIGAGGRGRRLVEEILENEGVELAVVCDVDERRALEKAEQARKISGRRPRVEKDLRRIMDDASIDAVTIATCNHWHALAGIWACQAGKHVYVEKRIAHNVWEGRKLVEATRKYDRIVQGGTNRRSSGSFRTVAQLVRDGVIGRVYWARCEFPRPRDPLGVKPAEPPPSWLDWNLWLGPAPEQAFHRNLVHYNWHWFWDFGNGEMGNISHRVGREVRFDPVTETIPGDEEASRLLRREYRKPFEVPEKV